MKTTKYILSLAILFLFGACDLDKIVDPNNPSLDGIGEDASIAQLNNLVTGTLSQMRLRIGTYHDVIGVIGRDIYRFSGSDPRFVADLLNGVLDNNAFYTTRPWGERYRTIKNANLLMEAVQNTNAVTGEELQAYLGFAKTIQAHEFLMVLNMQNENGIRIDVRDPENLGPLVSKSEALEFIAGLLDEAAGHLQQAGEEFPFLLSTGFAGFDAPASFLTFNRALAARVAAYRENFDQVLQLLDESFLDPDGDFYNGVYLVFSAGPGDQLNPMFLPRNNTGEVRAAHPGWVANAEVGDERLQKVAKRDEPVSNTDLRSEYDVFLYPANTSPVTVIRNEELILLYAEAKIQTDELTDAVEAINTIRNGAGLDNYKDEVAREALIDEMLRQRQYSLWYEGHRWVDMRRYGKLDELPLDRDGDLVHVNFPIPFDDLNIE
jgi:hypothetical protein